MTVSQYLKKSFFYALDFAYDIKDALIPSSQKVQIQRTSDYFLQTQTYPEGWSPERQFTAAERDYVYLKRSYFVKEKASPMETALFNALNDIRKDGQNPEKTLCDALCHLTAAQWNFSRKKALFLRPENDFLILNYFKRIALEKGAAQDSPAIQYLDRTMQSCPIKVFTRLFSENEVDSYYKKMNQSNSIKKAVGIPLLCMALFFGLYSIYNKGIADFFMRNTIFHAMDSQRISEEIQRNTSLNWMEQIGSGIYSEFEDFLPSVLKYALLHSIGKYAAKKNGSDGRT